MDYSLEEHLLNSWLAMSSTIWNERFMHDLTFNEAFICNLLYNNSKSEPDNPLTATDLCRKTNLLKSQMNKILSEMEQKQFISRRRSETDRRRIMIALSASGEAAYLKEHAFIMAFLQSVVSVLGEDFIRNTCTTFDTIVSSFDQLPDIPQN